MIYTLIYILNAALSVILIHFIGIKMPNMLMVFMSISYAILVFHIINIKKLPELYKTLFLKYKKKLFLLNLSVLVLWLGTFLIPVYFTPAIMLTSYMSVLAICGTFYIYSFTKNPIHLIKLLCLILNLAFFYSCFSKTFTQINNLILIISTIITGLAGYSYLRLSGKLVREYTVSSTQILAVRFWLIWLLSLFYIIYDHELLQFHLSYVPSTMFITMFSLILPIYFSQKSVEKIGADKSSVFMGLTPIAVVIFQYFLISHKIQNDYISAFILSLIIISFYCYEFIKPQKIKLT